MKKHLIALVLAAHLSRSYAADKNPLDYPVGQYLFRLSVAVFGGLLRWCRTVGYAHHDGVSVDMREPGADIEYLPGVRMTVDARDALQGPSTLAVVGGCP